MSSVCTASIRQKFVHTNTYTFVDCIVNLQVYGLTVEVADTEPPFLALSVAGISAHAIITIVQKRATRRDARAIFSTWQLPRGARDAESATV